MDWQLRIALAIVGLMVIGYIVYDFKRRKQAQADKKRLIEQMHESANQVDAKGFDFTGVGNVRPAGDSKSDISTQQSEVEVKNAPEEQLNLDGVGEKETSQSKIEQPKFEQPELVISLILKADEDAVYRGKDFMPLLLSQGLRHGDLGIFHRHSGASGKPGPVMYSVANAIKPGTFELNNIERFETPAFAFFVSLPGPTEPVAAFEGMVKTIRLLKSELGGQILDDTKSVYTEQTYQHQLDTIHEYVTKSSLRH